MPALNLRKVDVTLVTRLKADAASARVTLKDHCVGLLEATRGRRDDDGRGSGSSSGSEIERTGNGATMPVLPKAKSSPKRLHPMHEVRAELESGASDRSASISHATHRTYRAGNKTWCTDCKLYF